MNSDTQDNLEFAHGVAAIAKVLNTTERQTRQLLDKKRVAGAFKLNWKWSLHLPTFRADIAARIAERGGRA